MKAAARGDRLTVKIESLAVGGRGVARHQGLVIFVSTVAPQDEVEVELTSVKKNFAEARVVRLIQASPLRRKPPCRYAAPEGQCGGCSWQHVEYQEQLRQKRAIIIQALRRQSGFAIDDEFVAPVVPSPNELRYRNRIQLHHGGGKLSYFKRGSHEIVDIDDCLITEEAITREIPRLKKNIAGKPPGRLELLVDQSEKFAVRPSGKSGNDGDSEYDNDDNDHATAAGPAFSQVNRLQNQALIDFVVSAVKNVKSSLSSDEELEIYDLFAGQGNFTFPLAKAIVGAKLTAIELNHEAVRLGEARARDERAKIVFRQSDVGRYLLEIPPIKGVKSVVLLDPPRTGCAPEIMRRLAESSPARIVYVSCHPVTLARDLRFLHGAGFELLAVQPFDMFPQTDHVETVAVLKSQT